MSLLDVSALLGLLLIFCASYECTKLMRALEDNGGSYPTIPLTIQQFDNVVMQGRSFSRTYYEAYALQPTYFRPVLRKVSVRWKVVNSDIQNDYAGWYPLHSMCTNGVITFQNVTSYVLRFKFQQIYPTRVYFIGTIFSSYPEKYLINWYCPENELVEYRCRDGLRMSITSPDGMDRLPLQLVDDDLRRNGSPPRSNSRWMMTQDAPQQCQFQGANPAVIVG